MTLPVHLSSASHLQSLLVPLGRRGSHLHLETFCADLVVCVAVHKTVDVRGNSDALGCKYNNFVKVDLVDDGFVLRPKNPKSSMYG